MKQTDVLIVGAGLSGLAAALTLKNAGVKSLILEAKSHVGGRVETKKTTEGFTVDVGFQVLLSSYPELERFVDLAALDLKKFNSGALVFDGQKLNLIANPLVHPESLASAFSGAIATTKDKLLVLKLLAQAQFVREDSPQGEMSTENFLKEFGFSENFIEMFWRPFLAGVYLDPKLELGSDFFKFLIRCFGSGKVSVPAKGMAELPSQMAAKLPKDSIGLNQPVKSIASDHVILASGERLEARHVICAFDQTQAADKFRTVTTYYFTGENLRRLDWGPWLVLVPQKLKFGIDHLTMISDVADSYGNGRSLLSVSVVGPKNISVGQVLQEIDQIAGQELNLKLVESHSVARALPKGSGEAIGFKLENGVYFCGDRWTSPSINGALRSGRLTAEAILNELR